MATEPREFEPTATYVPGGAFVPPSPAELTARLPNLEVSEILGHGGMGVVYKGRQPFLDRPVAIKLIRPDISEDEESQRRFIHETQVTLEFRPHGDMTDVILTHERFRDEELRKDHTTGWTGCLNRLAQKLKP